MDMRLHVLKIATRFKTNLPKGFAARLKPVIGRTQVGGMWGAGPVADLNHRGFVPDGCLEKVGQGGVCLRTAGGHA